MWLKAVFTLPNHKEVILKKKIVRASHIFWRCEIRELPGFLDLFLFRMPDASVFAFSLSTQIG